MPPENLPATSRAPVVISPLRPAEAKSHFAFTIFKWYPLILGCGLALMIAAAIAMVLKPVPPSATARILIKSGPDTLPVTGLPVAAGVASQEFLQTEAELLTNRIVLLPVARALRQERGAPAEDAGLDEDVVGLRDGLVVTVIPGTTMLQVKKSAPTVAEAERLLGMILASYVEQHATAYSGSTGFATFFEREAGAAASQLREAEERLQRWREANGLVDAEEQLLAQLAAVGDAENALRRAGLDIEGTRAHLAAITRDLAALPRESVTTRENMANPLIARLKTDIATEEAALRGAHRTPVTERLQSDIANAELAARDVATSPLVAKLKADLVTAELALSDVRQRYTDEDRRVQEKLEQIARLRQGITAAEQEAAATAEERARNLRSELAATQRDVEATARERIAGLRAQLAAAERERDVFGRETVAPNPLREILNRDLVTERARLATLLTQRDGMRDELNEAKKALAILRDKRVAGARLSREVELAKAVHLQNAKRLDDARLTIELRKQQLTNIAVTEPPRAAAGSRSPKQVAMVSVLGLVVGLALGVAFALALDFFNWALRTPDDVEFYLGVPTLAAIPAVNMPRSLPHPASTLEDRPMDTRVRSERS
jgi:uncharacterized protein involved in exopolysaccharide biosynthesis